MNYFPKVTDGNKSLLITKHCRESVLDFAIKMEDVLRENDHKGGWQNKNYLWLCAKLTEEVGELAALINESPNSPDYRRIKKEAADVANIAMMIFDNTKK